jgi:hypothetical protein
MLKVLHGLAASVLQFPAERLPEPKLAEMKCRSMAAPPPVGKPEEFRALGTRCEASPLVTEVPS